MNHLLVHNYKALVEAVPDAILHLNQTGDILSYKPPHISLPNLAEFQIGKNICDILPAALAEEFLRYSALALAQDEVQTWLYPVCHSFQEARAVAVATDEVAIFIRDVTPQQRRENTLPQSEQYYRHLIRNLPCGVLIQSVSGEILLSNQTAENLLGLSEDQLYGNLLTRLNIEIAAEHDTGSAEIIQLLHETITHAQPLQNLVVRVKPANTHFRVWLLVNIVPEKDPDGLTQYVIVTLSDITDFKNAEAALNTSEEQYQALVDSVQEVIFWTDKDDIYVFLNPAWEQITGFGLHESIGRCWLDFLLPLDYDRVRESFQRARVEQHTEYRETLRLRTGDARFRWVDIHARLMRAADHSFIGMSGTLSDVTERKLNEENTIRLGVQERSIEVQRQLLANLSHDIRTPLSIISTNAYLLQHRLVNAEKRQAYLKAISQQIELLTVTIERISIVAKLSIGAIPFHFVATQINDLIRQLIARRDNIAQVNSVSFRLQLDPNLPPILADQHWTLEMLDNLLSNSIQYTPPNGEIQLTTTANPDGVILELTDTGMGIAPEVLDDIFEPFYKADKARSNIQGSSGLGLSVVKQVVRRHGGDVKVESQVGRGTAFRIFLPFEPERAATHD